MISEADWEQFKKVKVATLDRYCKMTLDDAVERINNDALSNHEKYISLYKLINSCDKKCRKYLIIIRERKLCFSFVCLNFRDY